jgi:Cellulase (glycosyl hydrolase family 5)
MRMKIITNRIISIFDTVVIIAMLIMSPTMASFAYFGSSNANQVTPNLDRYSIGVNMRGYHTFVGELREFRTAFPPNYYEDSFRAISQSGMNTVRYLFTWESFEKNPRAFLNELNKVSESADKYGISMIYANDQHRISSWLDNKHGYGFPSLLFVGKPEFPRDHGGAPASPTAKLWWTEWYNRSIKNENGTADGWSLQADFLKKIVRAVDNHSSTLGYEILNEPVLYTIDQWEKIGKFNTFITDELRTITKKLVVFDRQLPSDIGGMLDAFPHNMAKMAPTNKTNVIFKTSIYGLPDHCSYAEQRLAISSQTANLLGVPLWIGEFNIGVDNDHPTADINQTQLNIFVQKFKELGAWGWSFWVWNFKPLEMFVNNFNLAQFHRNISGYNLQTTKYFEYFKNTLTDTSNNTKGDTICPTVIITKVGNTKTGMKYSSTTPIVLNETAPSADLSVEGVSSDSGSGVKAVEAKLDDGLYKPVTPKLEGDWSYWSTSMSVGGSANRNDTSHEANIHKLVVKATDAEGNSKYATIFIKVHP